jgi:hypothetical protein
MDDPLETRPADRPFLNFGIVHFEFFDFPIPPTQLTEPRL